MFYWIVLLVFGVPLVTIVMQSFKSSQERNERLDEIRTRLAEKREEDINSKLATMKEKSRVAKAKARKGSDSGTQT